MDKIARIRNFYGLDKVAYWPFSWVRRGAMLAGDQVARMALRQPHGMMFRGPAVQRTRGNEMLTSVPPAQRTRRNEMLTSVPPAQRILPGSGPLEALPDSTDMGAVMRMIKRRFMEQPAPRSAQRILPSSGPLEALPGKRYRDLISR